jgi:hypothetical protein
MCSGLGWVRGIPGLRIETGGTQNLWLGKKWQQQEQPRILRLPAVAQEDSAEGVGGIPTLGHSIH